ncbi:MAG: zinc-dependent metalloprotease, partial [Bacteroidales bacterium]|nr:zinc-dependent metalloprotease [Bacteroidales bacterium]
MSKIQKIFCIVLMLGLCCQGVCFGKKKPKADTAVKQTEYQKLLKKGKTTTVKSNFITLHKVEDKLYFELPVKYIGREMLMASTPSEVSTLSYANIGMKETGTQHVKFTRIDNTIYLCRINKGKNSDDTNAANAVKITSLDPVLFTYKIAAFNKDSSAVVFDAAEPFCSDAKIFSLFKDRGPLKVNGVFNKEAFKLLEFKSFDDNLSIKNYFSYTVSISYQGKPLVENVPYTMKVTRSLLLLPEEKMKPRIVDSRVGVFRTGQERITDKLDELESYAVVDRWKLVPKDTVAYFRGELVEPQKPIVFYVDNNFPEKWKKPIKEGVEKWNMAFEKIGFKNAVICKDFPVGDSCFDPDNLKYSCIRYLPSSTANAMGPSWVDPATGEIINASVIVWSNITQIINNWRFVQTAQIDPRVRSKKMPDDIISESLIYVISHEIGHCLGFMHNMGASFAFDVDSLRSPSFTQQYGTTPCIMDYARFNYVAQPQDKGVLFAPPELGVYDYFFVKWSYTYLPDSLDEWGEQPIVESWVDEHAGDPVYRFGYQQTASRYDPSSIEEDLGNDPVRAGNYGISNLKFILSHLSEWIGDDPDYAHRLSLYNALQTQYYRYIRNAMYNIGGIYLAEVKEGTAGEKHTPVAREKQQQSLQWVLNEYKNATWLDNDSLKQVFPMRVAGSSRVRSSILSNIKGLFHNIVLASYYSVDVPYSIDDFSSDLYKATWSTLLRGSALTEGDIALQKAIVEMLCESLGEGLPKTFTLVFADDAFSPVPLYMPQSASPVLPHTPSLADIEAYGLGRNDCGFSSHGQSLADIEASGVGMSTGMSGYHFGCDFEQPNFGKTSPYLWKVDISAIDQTEAYLQDMAVRSRDLLKSRLGSASAKDKIHYQSLLI